MSDSDFAPLTSAAERALEEYLNEVRDSISLDARRRSAAISPYPEVGVREVLQAIRRREGLVDAPYSTFRMRIARLYYIGGVVLLSSGIILYLTNSLKNSTLTSAQFVAIATAIGGITMGLTGIFLSYSARAAHNVGTSRISGPYIDMEYDSRSSLQSDFIFLWAEFERRMRAFTADKYGESKAVDSPLELAMRLHSADILSRADIDDIKRFSSLRNEIVHGGLRIPSDSAMRSSLKRLVILNSKLGN